MDQGNRKATRASKKQPSLPQPTIDQRSFELVRGEQKKLSSNEDENIVSQVNRALHKEGISSARVETIRSTDTGRLLGATTPTSTLQDLLKHRDVVLRAARAVSGSIGDLTPQ